MRIANKITLSFFIAVTIVAATSISVFYMQAKKHLEVGMHENLKFAAQPKKYRKLNINDITIDQGKIFFITEGVVANGLRAAEHDVLKTEYEA